MIRLITDLTGGIYFLDYSEDKTRNPRKKFVYDGRIRLIYDESIYEKVYTKCILTRYGTVYDHHIRMPRIWRKFSARPYDQNSNVLPSVSATDF